MVKTRGGKISGGQPIGGKTRGGKTGGGLVRRSARQQGLDARPWIKPTLNTKQKKKKIADLINDDFEVDQEHVDVEVEKDFGDEEIDQAEEVVQEKEVSEEAVETERTAQHSERMEAESDREHDSEPIAAETGNMEQDLDPIAAETGNKDQDSEPIAAETGNKDQDSEPIAAETGNKDQDSEPIAAETGNMERESEPIAVETGNRDQDSQKSEAATEIRSTERSETPPSATRKKKSRGPTKMRKVATDPQDRVQVLFTELGEHAGAGSVTLSSFLGALVREHVPVIIDDWRKVDDQTRAILWEEIQRSFNLQEEWQKDAVFKQMGCLWRAGKSRLVSQVRDAKSSSERNSLKPSNISSIPVWNSWVKSRTSSAFKEISNRYRKLRRAQIPHTTSRKGMFRLAHEMKKKSADPKTVTRSKVWIAGHTHANGRPVRPEFADTIEQIQSLDSEMDSTSGENIREDAVSKVLGKDKPGRVRGMGRGITATKLAFMKVRDSKIEELTSEVQDLKNMVRHLAENKKTCGDIPSQSEVSDVIKEGVRCQILDWFEAEDVVVGEGEFCSADPNYRIGRIPLGPNAAAVIIKSVIDPEACVWRPTTDVFSLKQAMGVKVAWPDDKVILDTGLESRHVSSNTDGSKDTNSDDQHERCKIFGWNKDELIAEGILCSSDPKELLNDIPLGRNAVMLKVNKVIKPDAYLWRPSAEIFLMGAALNENIAWPIDKIELVNIPAREVVKRSTQSGSNSTSTSKGGKKKCILLDCNNSGRRVAEGRVCSTDPADAVHHVPLGPNASKVWVEVSKIGDAIVWRPNSEITYISDAIGTTVAWPNDKLLFV